MDPITLSELSNQIKNKLYEGFPDSYWVVAEISEAKVNYSGHCYLELIEKDENGKKLTTKARATIWAYIYKIIAPYFKEASGLELQEGIKILFKTTVEYHPLYGLSLNILDIDPTYSLGDYEKQKREIIAKLIEDGIFDLNRELTISPTPSNIAVISSSKAAGYQDFCKQIENKSGDFKINHKLFNASMQGDTAQNSIISALDKIYNSKSHFDLVVIIRGGGSRSDLMCFDNYELAANVAQFPIPIITGIGHEKDESIVDMVANTKLKTPTAVADFICDCFVEQYNYLMELAGIAVRSVERKLFQEKSKLEKLKSQFIPLSQNRIHNANKQLNKLGFELLQNINDYSNTTTNTLNSLILKTKTLTNQQLAIQKNSINNYGLVIKFKSNNIINNHKNRLIINNEKASFLNPEHQLKKGYSITKTNKKALKTVNQISVNDKIEVIISDGQINATINSIISKSDNQKD